MVTNRLDREAMLCICWLLNIDPVELSGRRVAFSLRINISFGDAVAKIFSKI